MKNINKMKEAAGSIMIAGFVIIWVVFVACACTGLIWGLISLGRAVWLRPAKTMAVDTPCDGVGRVPSVERYLGGEDAETVPSLWVVCEDDPVKPEWWDPDGAVLVYTDAPKKDIGCPDWNVDSTLWGWDGHGMEVWEMELFARIAYLEFWGTSRECTEAGIDSMLRLWDMGEYGRTMGELLSAQYAPGYYVYSPYAYVWEWEYDAEGLAGIRAMCEERFANGPEWEAPYFRLWYYHPWAVPAYEIDGVYFSVARG